MTDREAMQQALDALDYEAERGYDDGYRQLRDALRERLAQPEQEPLALTFINTRMDGCKHRVTVFPEDFQENRGDLSSILEGQNVVALYTTPPQRTWVGLTDEERNNLWREVVGWGDPSHDDEDLMKAIEAKLKEKNNG